MSLRTANNNVEKKNNLLSGAGNHVDEFRGSSSTNNNNKTQPTERQKAISPKKPKKLHIGNIFRDLY